MYDRLIAKRIVQNATLVIYAAKGEGDDAQQAYVVAAGDTRPRSVIVPDGFDPAPYDSLPPRGEFRSKYLAGHTGPLVLFLARLECQEGIEDALPGDGRR